VHDMITIQLYKKKNGKDDWSTFIIGWCSWIRIVSFIYSFLENGAVAMTTGWKSIWWFLFSYRCLARLHCDEL